MLTDLIPYLVASGAAASGSTTLVLNVGSGGGYPVLPGDTIIVCGGGGNVIPTGVSDSQGNNYVLGPSQTTGIAGYVFTAQAGAHGLRSDVPDTVTITYAGTGTAKTASVYACPGILATGAVDAAVTNSAAGTSTAPAVTAAGAPAAAGELVLGLIAASQAAAPTWGSHWLQLGTQQNNAGTASWSLAAYTSTSVAAYPPYGPATAPAVSGTLGSSVAWTAYVIALKPAPVSQRGMVGLSCWTGTYGGSTRVTNSQDADAVTGRKMAMQVQRTYFTEGQWPSTINSPQELGHLSDAKIFQVVSFKPNRAVGGGTSSERTNLSTALKLFKNYIAQQGTPNAGFAVAFWQECNGHSYNGPFGDGSVSGAGSPYGSVTTDAQAASNFHDYVTYYGPTVLAAGIPLAYMPAIYSPASALTFFPGRALTSFYMLDYYCRGDWTGNGYTLTSPSDTLSQALGTLTGYTFSPPLPYGFGEWGYADGPNLPTDSQFHSWVTSQLITPLQNFMTSGGYLAFLIWYTGGSTNTILSTSATVADIQALYDALDASASLVTAPATLAAGFTLSAHQVAAITGAAVISPSFRVSSSTGAQQPLTSGSVVPLDEWGKALADSLVLGGQIELLGGGMPSTNPDCLGAVFRLAPGYDLSAPAMTAEMAAGLLLDGEMISGMRASNRLIKLPVVIVVPPTGDLVADRTTLASARELILRLAAQEHWTLTWAREGGYPLVYDCQGISSTTITYSTKLDRQLASLVEIEFSAMPYGRSEDPEQIQVNTPSQVWDQPPGSVLLDDFTVATNFLTGDAAGFDSTSGDWTSAGNATVARSTAQFRTGPASLAVTSQAAGNMTAASQATADYATLMMPCQPGDTISIGAFSRAATVARSVNVAAEYFDSLGNNLGVPSRGSNVTNTTTGFTANPVFTGTAPGGAFAVRVSFQVVGTAGAGEVHYIDDVSINRGPAFSNVDPLEWTSSTVTPLTGQKSAYWSRNPSDHPVYDRTLPGQLDITGRVKFSFWAGFASTASMYHVWHKGTIHYSVTLTDDQGTTLSFGVKMLGQVSALSTIPHWQHITAPIPQVSGFDYTNIAGYRVEAWNTFDNKNQVPVLQASMYLAGVQAQATSVGSAATRSAWLSLPGIKGTARAPLALQIAPGTSSFSSVALFTTPGSNNWTAPVGLTKIDKVECWGAGGGGAAGNNSGSGWGGGGGGAGEYAQDINVPVTAGNTYHPVVGAGGQNGTITSSPANDATSGADSYFVGDGGNQTNANGGTRGYITRPSTGGQGGSGSNDYLHHPGGSGFPANVQWDGTGGGGGSSGGPGAAGVDAGGELGAQAVTGGGAGGKGGARPTADFNAGRAGVAPGGGGGGGAVRTDGSIAGGGSGANGQVRLSYGATGIFPLASFLVHMPQIDAPAALNPVCSVGNGADPPDGREYTFPAISNLNARFDGTYTIYLIASAWNTPASSRLLTVQLRQYPYSGGTAFTAPALTRTVTPNTDITNGYVDMGALTLPLAELPPGNTDSYFTVGVTSGNASDRFYDILLLDSQGQLILVNMPGTAWCNLAWIDEADRDRDLGRVSGSDTDLNRARSLLTWTDRMSGGPMSVVPDQDNRLLLYATQGVPAATAFYSPRWWTERLA